MTIPLVYTVRKEEPLWDAGDPRAGGNDWGVAIIEIAGREVGRVNLTYNQWDSGRDGLEAAAADWFAQKLGGTG